MLLRIQNGAGGYVNTEQFIGQAEKSGLIRKIDRHMFTHACEVAPTMRKYGITQISVNLSPHSCMGPELAVEAQEIMERYDTDPTSLCIEVTEAGASIDEKRLVRSIQTLQETGVKIAIDDFGKGYSGIGRLLSVPFHVLKLDKSLIDHLTDRELVLSLVKSIIGFAQENGMSVVAEGIETGNCAQQVTALHCDCLQGYYFSKPLAQHSFSLGFRSTINIAFSRHASSRRLINRRLGDLWKNSNS